MPLPHFPPFSSEETGAEIRRRRTDLTVDLRMTAYHMNDFIGDELLLSPSYMGAAEWRALRSSLTVLHHHIDDLLKMTERLTDKQLLTMFGRDR